jgi:hypothetical protein
LFSDLLKGASRVVSDELEVVLTQANCPRVSDIFTAVLFPPASIRFPNIEEFLASSEVFVPNIKTDIIIGSNCISAYNILFSTVQPVPAPFSTKELTSSKINEGGNNQKLILFNLGNAINFVINLFFNFRFSYTYA